MRYRSLALAVATLSSTHLATAADAQSVYVAPGGVYVASGPVYVTPAPNYAPTPYVTPAPTNGVPYDPAYAVPPYVTPGPAYVAPAPAYAAPPAYAPPPPAYVTPAPAPAYVAPSAYPAPGYVEPAYVVRERRVAPLAAYAAEIPRPSVAVPYRNGGRCVFRSGYGRWEYCD